MSIRATRRVQTVSRPMFALLGLVIATPGRAQAGEVIADVKIIGPSLDFGSGKATAVTIGRSCVYNKDDGTTYDQDPAVTGCRGGSRVVPPAVSATHVIGLYIVVGHGLGGTAVIGQTKHLHASAFVAALAFGCFTLLKDPITVQPESVAYSTPITEILDTLRIETAMVSGGPERAVYHRQLSCNLTGSAPLYTLEVRAEGGQVPIADFGISSTLASQGWNEAALESSLSGALESGSISAGAYRVTGFQLPSILFDVPADSALVLDTEDSLQVIGPESTAGVEKPYTRIPFLLRPNPLSSPNGDIGIDFELDEPDLVQVSLLDIQGREVLKRRPELMSSAGSHSLRWNLGDIPAGSYVVVVQTGGGLRSAVKITVLP